MKLYYENHLGGRIYFYDSPYILTSHDFFNWTMAYTTVNNKSSSFKFNKAERSFNVRIMPKAVTAEARLSMYATLIDEFVSIVSADVDQPGRLYTDRGDYLECRIVEANKSAWDIARSVTLACKMLIDYPMWQRQTTYDLTYGVADGSDAEEGNSGTSGTENQEASGTVGEETAASTYPYLDYPIGYDYDYKGTFPAHADISNSGTEASDYILAIYGPVTNPLIILNDIKIGAVGTVGLNEYLVVNTRDQTVELHKSNGEIENWFNNRYKGDISMFSPIPVGDLNIIWSGGFRATITMLEERREPRWNP